MCDCILHSKLSTNRYFVTRRAACSGVFQLFTNIQSPVFLFLLGTQLDYISKSLYWLNMATCMSYHQWNEWTWFSRPQFLRSICVPTSLSFPFHHLDKEASLLKSKNPMMKGLEFLHHHGMGCHLLIRNM